MFEWIPPGVALTHDVSVGDWIVSDLEPWDRERAQVRSFMPGGFDGYVRIFHPLDGPVTSWAELGAGRGVGLSAEVSLEDVLGLEPETAVQSEAPPLESPVEGQLPQDVCATLVAVLSTHTQTEQTCWFAMWEGWGALVPGGQLYAGRHSRKDLRRERKERRQQRAALEETPKMRGVQRNYLLLRGKVESACSFGELSYATPSLWWPDDRAWMVATEIDGTSTYVGATRAAIDDLTASDLEVVEVIRDAPMA
jgi:hypothetical protein